MMTVEKVLVQDRRNFQIWYKLPEFQGVRTLADLVAPGLHCTNSRRRVRHRLSVRAVFLLDARDQAAGSRSRANVRIVGRGVGVGTGTADPPATGRPARPSCCSRVNARPPVHRYLPKQLVLMMRKPPALSAI